MGKMNLELDTSDVVGLGSKPFSIADAPIVDGVDLRDGHEYREKAKKMQVGQAILDMPHEAAARLYRAIEEMHGPRRATIKGTNGRYSVKVVEQRPARERKPRAANGLKREVKA